MSSIANNSNGGQTDPYEQEGNREKEKELERRKPNGEQDRIDAEEERIANEDPEENGEEE